MINFQNVFLVSILITHCTLKVYKVKRKRQVLYTFYIWALASLVAELSLNLLSEKF